MFDFTFQIIFQKVILLSFIVADIHRNHLFVCHIALPVVCFSEFHKTKDIIAYNGRTVCCNYRITDDYRNIEDQV